MRAAATAFGLQPGDRRFLLPAKEFFLKLLA